MSQLLRMQKYKYSPLANVVFPKPVFTLLTSSPHKLVLCRLPRPLPPSSQQASLVLDSFLPGEENQSFILHPPSIISILTPSTMRFSIVTLVVATVAAVSQAAVIPRANTLLTRAEARYFADQIYRREEPAPAPAPVKRREYTGYTFTPRSHARDFVGK